MIPKSRQPSVLEREQQKRPGQWEGGKCCTAMSQGGSSAVAAQVMADEKTGSTRKNAGPTPGHCWEEKEFAEQRLGTLNVILGALRAQDRRACHGTKHNWLLSNAGKGRCLRLGSSEADPKAKISVKTVYLGNNSRKLWWREWGDETGKGRQ